MPDKPSLPSHVEESVEAIAKLHAQHERETSRSQRLANNVVNFMGSGAAIALLTGAILVWLAYNLVAPRLGLGTFDHPPFSALQTVLSAVALYVTLTILRTQRHDDAVSRRRDRLTLQLAILSDRKAAKLIALLEGMRRESPFLDNRDDAEAVEMSVPSDPHAVLKALRETDERT